MVAPPLTGQLFVGADRVAGTGGAVRARDPRTGVRLDPPFGAASADQVRAAARLAAGAAAEFRNSPPRTRAVLLERIADGLDEIADAVVERVGAETGIPPERAGAELGRTTGQLRMFAGVVRAGDAVDARLVTPLPDRTPLPRPDLRLRMVAVGPVAVFAASNFPLAFSVAGGDTAAALAAGCPVVVKAHGAHPGTSELVGEVVRAAVADLGLPGGVFSLLHGPGAEVGTALVGDPAIRAVGFTGSRSGGTALMAAAAARPVPIPVYAEMSSVNPVFLLPGAVRDRAEALAAGYVASMTIGVGQLCTNPGIVVAVDGPDARRFLAAAVGAVGEVAAQPMLTAGIATAYAQGVGRLGAVGATEIASGQADDSLAAAGVAHLFTASADDFLADPDLHAEVFGATSLVVLADRAEQLPAVLDSLEGQLTCGVHCAEDDGQLARELLGRAEDRAGRIIVNGWPTGVEVCDAMVHGGPFPATSDSRTTSVGTKAIERFLRPVCYQNVPDELLPPAVQDANPWRLPRRVDGVRREP